MRIKHTHENSYSISEKILLNHLKSEISLHAMRYFVVMLLSLIASCLQFYFIENAQKLRKNVDSLALKSRQAKLPKYAAE